MPIGGPCGSMMGGGPYYPQSYVSGRHGVSDNPAALSDQPQEARTDSEPRPPSPTSAAPESPEAEAEALGNSEPDYKAHADALAEALEAIVLCADEFGCTREDDWAKARAALAAYQEVKG